MLSRLQGRPRPLHVLTWDLEWDPKTLKLRIAGLYDGKQYRYFLNLESFVEHVLRPRYSGAFLFAHFGGRFDEVFLLPEITKLEHLNISMAFSGASCVLLDVRDNAGHRWRFVDSQFLFKEPLKMMGKSIGLLKPDCPFDAPLPQLRDRNEADCVILYRVIDRAARSMADLGSGLSYTIASTALQLFRRKYLDRDIPTSIVLNSELRPGYIASRVENLAFYSDHGSHYDINSSFPHSMLAPLPGAHIRTDRTLAEHSIAHCRVYVPQHHIPPLPIRLAQSIYFPTGTWDGIYTSEDLALLSEAGGRVEKVYRAHHFESFTSMGDYARDVYRLRKQNKESPDYDEFLDLWFKKLQNALYGKLGERGNKERIVFRPRTITCPHEGGVHNDAHGKPSCMHSKGSPEVWGIIDPGEPKHTHLPIVMTITSRSRASLTRYMWQTPNLANVDTDGVFGEGEFFSSKELGALKHVYDYTNGVFARPKLYAVDLCEPWATKAAEDAKLEGSLTEEQEYRIRRQVKAKGFPRLNREDFEQLIRGGSIDTRVFYGVRMLMKQGSVIGPIEKTQKKHLYRVCRRCEAAAPNGWCLDHPEDGVIAAHKRPPKRQFHEGGSYPWEYERLIKMLNL